MKEGWRIRKMGEVCADFIVPQRDKPKSFDGDIPWCRIEDIEGKYLNGSLSGQKMSKALADKMNMHICPKGSVICACSASIGNQAITTIDCYTNQTFIGIVPQPGVLFNEFLYYFFKGKKKELLQMGTGATIKYISRKKFEELSIRVPPFQEQEKIVAELDCLSSIIEKKKQQLKELDNLAQSIFYDMFGDPITNEKGWEVKKLGDVCDTTSGGTPSKSHPEYYANGNIPWLRSGEVNQRFITETELFITEQGLKNSSAKWFPENTVAIAMYGATVGQVGIIKKRMTTNQAVCGIMPCKEFIPLYLYHFLLSKKDDYVKQASGGAQPNISQGIVRNTLICCPPIDLQNAFAQKMEAIEKQKELIKKSIQETETLFNSRMDYWFN